MNRIYKMMMTLGAVAAIGACSEKKSEEPFRYTVDSFADLKVMRYQVPGWDSLSLQQKEYAYHLAEAAKFGRDILWDQNCKDNLRVRHAVENILENYKGDRNSADFEAFTVYAKRLFFSNGMHHHYAEDKFFPGCPQPYFAELLKAVGIDDEDLLDVIYNPERYPQRRSTETSGDIVALSAVNFYDGVTRDEVEKYYAGIMDPKDPCPISYGLNTKVVKAPDGKTVVELIHEGTRYRARWFAGVNYQSEDPWPERVKFEGDGDFTAWLDRALRESIVELGSGLDSLKNCIQKLEDALGRAGNPLPAVESDILSSMQALRTTVDSLEKRVGDARWPLPKYRDMLFLY